VSEPRKRPSALWLLFYGRRRRGFPWLLVGVLAAILLLAALFAIPGAADVSRLIAGALFGLLIVGALVLAVVAVLRPRRRP
jgi:Na+/melibiose symporter-like transporter